MDKQKTIAIVDDDPGMLRGIARLLGAHGFGTRVFASAEAFLDDAKAETAACLVLDIDLGGIFRNRTAPKVDRVRFPPAGDIHHGLGRCDDAAGGDCGWLRGVLE